jgi:predicted GIY-YIG superfamily endonuclease
MYGGKCRSQVVVYCTECTITGKKYIGNTQQPIKTRMQQHKDDVRKRILKGKLTNSFAAHFAQLVPKNIHEKEITNNIKYKVEILCLARQPVKLRQDLWYQYMQALRKRTPCYLEIHQKNPPFGHQQMHRNLRCVSTQTGLP